MLHLQHILKQSKGDEQEAKEIENQNNWTTEQFESAQIKYELLNGLKKGSKLVDRNNECNEILNMLKQLKSLDDIATKTERRIPSSDCIVLTTDIHIERLLTGQKSPP
eukprot:143917_1